MNHHGVLDLEDLGVGRERLGRRLVGAVPGDDLVDHEDDRQRYHREAHHRVPAEQLGEDRREQRGEHGARIAHPGSPSPCPGARRIPPAGERNATAKLAPAKPEDHADRERPGEAVDARTTSRQADGHDDQLVERAGRLLSDAVAEQPVDDPQHAPASVGTATIRPFCAGSSRALGRR
jgi:hypothetical protein